MNRGRSGLACVPLGVPAAARMHRSGTTRLLVHEVLRSSRGRTQRGPLASGKSVLRRSCACDQAHRPRLGGRRHLHRLPNAFKRADRRRLSPAAGKSRPPRPMRSSDEMIVRMTVDAMFDRRPRVLRAANAEQTELCEVCEHRSPPFRGSRSVSVGKRPFKCGPLPSRSRCCRVRLPCLATPSAGLGSGQWRQRWYCPFCFLLVRKNGESISTSCDPRYIIPHRVYMIPPTL